MFLNVTGRHSFQLIPSALRVPLFLFLSSCDYITTPYLPLLLAATVIQPMRAGTVPIPSHISLVGRGSRGHLTVLKWHVVFQFGGPALPSACAM